MKVPEVTLLLLTPLKCDVFGRLKNSARNCALTRSLTMNSRVISRSVFQTPGLRRMLRPLVPNVLAAVTAAQAGSEEHTSELQSLRHLVCRLLLEKKKEF